MKPRDVGMMALCLFPERLSRCEVLGQSAFAWIVGKLKCFRCCRIVLGEQVHLLTLVGMCRSCLQISHLTLQQLHAVLCLCQCIIQGRWIRVIQWVLGEVAQICER